MTTSCHDLQPPPNICFLSAGRCRLRDPTQAGGALHPGVDAISSRLDRLSEVDVCEVIFVRSCAIGEAT